MKRLIVFFTLTFLFFCSYSQGVEVKESTQSVRQKIEVSNNIRIDAILNGDYDKILEFYDENVIVAPDFHPPLYGKKALRLQYEQERSEGVRYHSFTGTIDDLWFCNNKVYERGTFGMAISSLKLDKPIAYYGSYFQVWSKESGGEYKITYTIWNLDFNPFEPEKQTMR